MITPDAAVDLITREALYLDRRQWDDWLSLYTEDCVFWVPAWRDEDETTNDPDSELSLIYYRGRHNLRDRIWRVTSGLSVASAVLPRVSHQVTNIRVEGQGAVTAAFCTHVFEPKRQRQRSLFGRYDYELRMEEEALKIAIKKITLMNDKIQTVADFYMI